MKNHYVYQVLFLFAFLFLWELLVWSMKTPVYLIPAPSDVIIEITRNYQLFLVNAKITLTETILGFGLGVSIAFVLSVLISYSEVFGRIIYPYAVALQTIPRIAIAPLLLLWFGYGIFSKILISAIMGFFPVFVNLTVGLNSAKPNLMNLMKILKANKHQILMKVRLPSALPYFFTGLKVAATFSLIGAIVGEFVGGTAGLGYLIVTADADYNTTSVFASLFFLSLMGLFFVWLIETIEKITIH